MRRRGRGRAAVLGAALALALAELAVRALDLAPRPLRPLAVHAYRLSENPILRYEYRPGVRADEQPINRGHRGFETNSHGFRDDEHALAKPPGYVRIAVLGDSIVAGINNARREDLFSERLEALLAADGGGVRYEVLNLGVGGYHTLQEVELLRVRGLAFEPDWVLLALCINDFDVDSDGGVYARLRNANPDWDPSLASRSALGRLLEHSRLAFFAAHRLRALAGGRESRGDYAARFLGGRSSVEVGLGLLAELERRHGFRALVFVVPGFRSPFARYEHAEIHERVRAIADGLPELEVIDLLPDFARLDPQGSAFSNDGIHPHPRGHAALAAILHAKLRERGVGAPG
jgi:lysophospholipase L1-like esterase